MLAVRCFLSLLAAQVCLQKHKSLKLIPGTRLAIAVHPALRNMPFVHRRKNYSTR